MTWWLWAAGAVVFVWAFVWSLCRAAARGDRFGGRS